MAHFKIGTDGRVIYEGYSYAELGKLYGRTGRNVREWVRKGKANDNDIPPCPDPAAMLEWWGRNMKQDPPEEMVSAAVTGEAVPSVENSPAGDSSPDSGVQLGSVNLDTVDSGGADESYQRIASLEAQAYASLQKELAAAEPNKTLVDYWSKKFKEYSGDRRHWEKDISKIRKEKGELLEQNKLVSEFVSLATSIKHGVDKQMEALIDHVIGDIEQSRLIDLSDYMSRKEKRELCRRFVDAICADLRETEFTEAFGEAA